MARPYFSPAPTRGQREWSSSQNMAPVNVSEGLEGTLCHVSASGKRATVSLSRLVPTLGSMEKPADCGILRGHQGPWFAQLFTRKLDNGGQINKCK